MLAGHVFAVVQGMSTLAKDGAGRSKLMGIADAAMAGWPEGGADVSIIGRGQWLAVA